MDIGVERADVFLVGGVGGARQREQSLAPEAGLEGEDVSPGESGDQGDLQGVLDGGGAADRGQDEPEAGEVPEPIAEFGLEARASSPGDRGESHLVRVVGGVVAAHATGNPADDVEDGASVDDDEGTGGPDVRRFEPGRPDEPIERRVVIAPERRRRDGIDR